MFKPIFVLAGNLGTTTAKTHKATYDRRCIIMDVCTLCLGISPQAIANEVPSKSVTGQETTRIGYSHLDYDDLHLSAKTCSMCALLFKELKGSQLKPHRKPHTIRLTPDSTRKDRTTPYGIAGMTAEVLNSNFRAYFNVFALPGEYLAKFNFAQFAGFSSRVRYKA
jgi:hypothetical protein